MTSIKAPLFRTGGIYTTAGASEAVPLPYLESCIARHVSGDWGNVDPEDKATNDEAVKSGFRIISAYPIDPEKPCKGHGDNCLWIITEADRSVTTLLLPGEYIKPWRNIRPFKRAGRASPCQFPMTPSRGNPSDRFTATPSPILALRHPARFRSATRVFNPHGFPPVRSTPRGDLWPLCWHGWIMKQVRKAGRRKRRKSGSSPYSEMLA